MSFLAFFCIALCASLYIPNAYGDLGVEHLHATAIGSANQIHNILSEAWTFVHHGNEYAPDLKTGFILRLTFE